MKLSLANVEKANITRDIDVFYSNISKLNPEQLNNGVLLGYLPRNSIVLPDQLGETIKRPTPYSMYVATRDTNVAAKTIKTPEGLTGSWTGYATDALKVSVNEGLYLLGTGNPPIPDESGYPVIDITPLRDSWVTNGGTISLDISISTQSVEFDKWTGLFGLVNKAKSTGLFSFGVTDINNTSTLQINHKMPNAQGPSGDITDITRVSQYKYKFKITVVFTSTTYSLYINGWRRLDRQHNTDLSKMYYLLLGAAVGYSIKSDFLFNNIEFFDRALSSDEVATLHSAYITRSKYAAITSNDFDIDARRISTSDLQGSWEASSSVQITKNAKGVNIYTPTTTAGSLAQYPRIDISKYASLWSANGGTIHLELAINLASQYTQMSGIFGLLTDSQDMFFSIAIFDALVSSQLVCKHKMQSSQIYTSNSGVQASHSLYAVKVTVAFNTTDYTVRINDNVRVCKHNTDLSTIKHLILGAAAEFDKIGNYTFNNIKIFDGQLSQWEIDELHSRLHSKVIQDPTNIFVAGKPLSDMYFTVLPDISPIEVKGVPADTNILLQYVSLDDTNGFRLPEGPKND